MAKLKNPLLSFDARGSLTKAITFLRRRGVNLAMKTPDVPDMKTLAQVSWRHMYSKCATLWHTLSDAEKASWAALGSTQHMTGFAAWQSACLKPNPGIYLPLQGGTMSGDIDMAKNKLLKLPLPTDGQEAASKNYHDNADNVPVHGATKHTDITREVFLPATSGHYAAGSPWGIGRFAAVYGTADADAPNVMFTMKVPLDFVAFIEVKALWISPAAAGNMYWKLNAAYASDGEAHSIHDETTNYGITATAGANILNEREPEELLTLANLEVNDYLGLYFLRWGANALDTIDDYVYLLGLKFRYTASQ